MAERFGWTLDYIDGLDIAEVIVINTVLDAKIKAQNARLEAT